MKLNKEGFLSIFKSDIYITRLLLLMVAWMIFMAVFRSRFYSLVSFQNMGSQFPEFGLMSLGIMLCMITGGIDLSVVGVANLTSISAGILLKEIAGAGDVLPAYGIPAAILAGVLIGAISGAFNGVLIAKIGIPPILATLGTLELFTGIAIVFTGGKAVSGIPIQYAQTVAGKLLGTIPTQLVFFVVMAVILQFLLTRTTYGTKIYMLGTNMTAAKFSGLNTAALIIKTHVLSGICAAMGGLVMLANYNSARADYGTVYTLQCILIVVLGGVSPTGGKGKLGGVVLAICVLQMFSSGLNRFPQISAFYIPLIWGGVLLFVMVLNYFTDNKIKR
jgi:simple sugar transport system permease protein